MHAILFDVDGVLTHGYYNHFNHGEPWDKTIEEDLGLDKELFKNDFIFKDYVTKIIPGKLCFKEGLENFIKRNALPLKSQDIIDYWLSKDAVIYKPLLERIKQLKEMNKFQLFLATNQEHYRANYLMNELGFKNYFQDIFYAADLGAAKPDLLFFEKTEQRLKELGFNTKPTFFDDHPEIIKTAQTQGWDAHHFETVDDLNKSPILKNEDLF